MATTSKQILDGTTRRRTSFNGKLIHRQLESQTIFRVSKSNGKKRRIDNITELKTLYRDAEILDQTLF